jgi:hypothetical protein
MLSVVAGIVDAQGRLSRVVIDSPDWIERHAGPGETLYRLPDVAVIEPIALDHAADLIERVRRYIEAR